MRQYALGPLAILSALPLPELFEMDPTTDFADVIINVGHISSEVAPSKITQYVVSFDDGTILIHIPDLVRFLIGSKGRITVEFLSQEASNLWRLFFFSTVLSIIAVQRDLYPLRAASLRVGKKNVVILGRSGVGKSTLAAALIMRGHLLLSDDVSLLDAGIDSKDVSDRVPRLWPTFPRLKLWRDSVKNLGLPMNSMPQLRHGLPKFDLRLGTGPAELFKPLRYELHPCKIDVIFLLRESESVHISPTNVAIGTEALMDNLVGRVGAAYSRKLKATLERASIIAHMVPIFSLERPKAFAALDLTVAALERFCLA